MFRPVAFPYSRAPTFTPPSLLFPVGDSFGILLVDDFSIAHSSNYHLRVSAISLNRAPECQISPEFVKSSFRQHLSGYNLFLFEASNLFLLTEL
jgi:hypothetical protein